MTVIRRLLLATDGSPAAQAATEHALGLAEVHGATLDVLTVAETGDPPAEPEFPTEAYEDMVDDQEVTGHRLVAQVVDQAQDQGLAAHGHVERDRSAPEAILRVAGETGADLVVMGSQGRSGIERLLLGSVAEAVLRASPVPVLVIRSTDEDRAAGPPPYRRILVPVDGSPGWQGTMEAPIELARVHEAEVVLLYVVDGGLPIAAEAAHVHWGDLMASIRTFGREVLEEAADLVTEAGLPASTVLKESGRVHNAILEAAEKHEAELVVMATNARTGLARFLLGSVTERVLRAGRLPVLSLHLDG